MCISLFSRELTNCPPIFSSGLGSAFSRLASQTAISRVIKFALFINFFLLPDPFRVFCLLFRSISVDWYCLYLNPNVFLFHFIGLLSANCSLMFWKITQFWRTLGVPIFYVACRFKTNKLKTLIIFAILSSMKKIKLLAYTLKQICASFQILRVWNIFCVHAL